ncbi:MAG: nicotinate (nicotinamide) nucleotide adenylyltransferase [Clostridia bacterium]|nr:nicotinate (nicotinamide) nucleotide adenylyltransferase [Clostridia bacterium]
MRFAIFGGTFDPPHREHRRLAQAAVESLVLDKLFVMPAHTPPHKQGKTLTSDAERWELCNRTFSDLENVEVSDYELKKGGTSYTFETCRYFRKTDPSAEIFWIVGTDMLRDFPTWKNPESIVNDVTLAVCARNEESGWIEEEKEKFQARFGKSFAVIDYNGEDVSSTEIRVLAGAGMDINSFVTKETAEYILEKGLYEIPYANKALALEKPKRREHSIRVAKIAAARASSLKLSEYKTIAAALFHDCAKNLEPDSPYLQGFEKKEAWGEIPEPVMHQYQGAYVAEKFFCVTDEEILQAIRYHTSARPAMGGIEKLVFLADMIEEERSYDGVEILRELFQKDVDECLLEALSQTLEFLKEKKGKIYPLTKAAYEYYQKERKEKENGRNDE